MVGCFVREVIPFGVEASVVAGILRVGAGGFDLVLVGLHPVHFFPGF